MSSAILGGIGWHMVGAASAASFYAPIEKVKKWSWETTWAVAGVFSWVLLPLIVSLILLPDFHGFYAGIATGDLTKTFLFGCMWGIGNVNYGLTMRYLGMSLGIGVAIGVTLVVGTLVPPILQGQLAYLLTSRSGHFTMSGVALALVGIAIRRNCVWESEPRNSISARASCSPSCAAFSRRECRLPSRPQSRSPQPRNTWASSRCMRRCPATSSSWAAERW